MVWLGSPFQRTHFPNYRIFSYSNFANSIIRAAATLIGGAAIGLAYAWKPALVGIGWFHIRACMPHCTYYLYSPACVPLVFSTGYIRLVSQHASSSMLSDISKRVVGLKDQKNKSVYAQSTKLACEAAGVIRTVSSLTREEHCLQQYSNSLDEALRRSNKMAVWSNFIFAFSQSTFFWTVALVFWYGSIPVSRLEISTTAFFTAFMVRVRNSQ